MENELPDEQPSREWNYLPSPEEIEAACQLIQSEWSDEERLRRSAGLQEQTMARRMRAYAVRQGGAARGS